MKKIIIATLLLASTITFALPLKNKEYAAQAVMAANALNTLNWGADSHQSLEVIKEVYKADDVSDYGTYKVRLFSVDSQGKKSDAGKDFDVYIQGGAVLNVKINCRLCG
jgi:hypothetical protein